MNFNSILISSENPGQLIEFYSKVFDMQPGWESGGFSGWEVGDGYVVVGPHDKVKGKAKDRDRLILNFEVDDVKAEFARIKEAAEVVQEPYQPGEADNMWLATFADPDGNLFQIATPMAGEFEG